jgi:hypothetical protein
MAESSISSSPSSNRTFGLFPFGQTSPPNTAFRILFQLATHTNSAELPYVVSKNVFTIGKLEVFSFRFEPNNHHPIYTASDNPLLPFFHPLINSSPNYFIPPSPH